MDASYYVNLLSSYLLSLVQKMKISNFIFMQDNDPKHNSRLSKEFFYEEIDRNSTLACSVFLLIAFRSRIFGE